MKDVIAASNVTFKTRFRIVYKTESLCTLNCVSSLQKEGTKCNSSCVLLNLSRLILYYVLYFECVDLFVGHCQAAMSCSRYIVV